jgi:hypothetical protein
MHSRLHAIPVRQVGAAVLTATIIMSTMTVTRSAVAQERDLQSADAPSKVVLPFVAHPTSRPLFGLEMASVSNSGGLAQAAAADITWTRRSQLSWKDVQPTETGGYNWAAISGLEQEMINAAQNNMRMIMIVRSAPAWAQKFANNSCGPIRADKVAKFGDFMNALVARYSVSPYNVKYWEIWNEPDVDVQAFVGGGTQNIEPFGCYGDPADPYYGGGEYGEMLKVVYPRIKQADASAQVLNGGLLLDCINIQPNLGCLARNPPSSPASTRFLEGMLRVGAGNAFDILSIHAYDNYRGSLGVYGMGGFNSAWNTTGSVIHAKTQFVRGVLTQYGYGAKPIMNTEGGLGCNSDLYTCNTTYELSYAYYVPQLYAAVLEENLLGNIIYSATGTWQNSNLLNPSTLAPRPGFTALAFARGKFDGAEFVRRVTNIPNARVYEMRRAGKLFWVAVSTTGSAVSVTLPRAPARVFDSLGATVPAATTLNVGVNALYIEFP